MSRRKIPDEVLQALAEADRAPGWNNRSREIRRFELAGDFGYGCTLYVVPFRRWAYHRQERMTAEHLHEESNAWPRTAA